MTIQETILQKLPEEIQKSLIERQLLEANDILSRSDRRIESYTITALEVGLINPTQSGEDYKNPSSEKDAQDFECVRKGLKSIDEVRLDSFRPIVVDKATNEIIDGNHRHYATKAIGEKFIYTLLCEVETLKQFSNQS